MFNKLESNIKIVEVGPRDGLQNEKTVISTDDKIKYILKLKESGLKSIEVTSFVRGDKVPQMADSSDLYSKLKADLKDLETPCLVPNLKGFETALSVGVDYVALFSATSNTFNQKNINASIDESFVRLQEVATEAKAKNIKMRGYISTAFGCPYEGKISPKQTLELVERFFKLGVDELSIGDTIGVANPKDVQEVCLGLKANYDLKKMAMHFHDTRGTALANVLVSLENGIHIFDSSSGGLGGCPYAKGATGNLATEDLVYLMNHLGVKTGIDLKKLSEASQFILNIIGRNTESKFLRAFLATGY